MRCEDLQMLLDGAMDGATINIPPGSYEGTLRIDKNVRLIMSGVELRGAPGQTSAIRIRTSGHVVICGLTIAHAIGTAGAGIHVDGVATVTLEDVWIRGCTADRAGGGLHVTRSLVTMRGGGFEGCEAAAGGAIFVGEAARVRLHEVTFRDNRAKSGGAIRVCDQAEIEALGCRFFDNEAEHGPSISARGRSNGAPRITLVGSELDPVDAPLDNTHNFAATVKIHRNAA